MFQQLKKIIKLDDQIAALVERLDSLAEERKELEKEILPKLSDEERGFYYQGKAYFAYREFGKVEYSIHKLTTVK